MMPFWLYNLGHSLIEDSYLHTPYLNIIIALMALTVPIGIGITIQKFRPTWVLVMKRIIRPLTVFLLVFLVIGSFLSIRIFKLFTPSIAFAGASLVVTAYLTGALLAFFAGLTKPQIIAVSIETAIQNPGIAFVLLQTTLPQPESDLSAIPIIGVLFLTGPPLIFVYAFYVAFGFYRSRIQRRHPPREEISGQKYDRELQALSKTAETKKPDNDEAEEGEDTLYQRQSIIDSSNP